MVDWSRYHVHSYRSSVNYWGNTSLSKCFTHFCSVYIWFNTEITEGKSQSIICDKPIAQVGDTITLTPSGSYDLPGDLYYVDVDFENFSTKLMKIENVEKNRDKKSKVTTYSINCERTGNIYLITDVDADQFIQSYYPIAVIK